MIREVSPHTDTISLKAPHIFQFKAQPARPRRVNLTRFAGVTESRVKADRQWVMQSAETFVRGCVRAIALFAFALSD